MRGRAVLPRTGPPRRSRDWWKEKISAAFRAPVVRRHRTLEDYVGVLLGARFELKEFVEPMATEEEVRQSARFEHMTRIPYFVFMRWQRS